MWANASLGQEELRISHAALGRLEGFGIFWAEWRRSGLSSDDEKDWDGNTSKETCRIVKRSSVFISVNRGMDPSKSLYSFFRAAWTNSRCSRTINLQTLGRKHMSHTVFLMIPHVVDFLTRARILPKRFGNTGIMAIQLLLIFRGTIPPPPPPSSQQHNLCKGPTRFYY